MDNNSENNAPVVIQALQRMRGELASGISVGDGTSRQPEARGGSEAVSSSEGEADSSQQETSSLSDVQVPLTLLYI